ncbi:hypothetical protein KO481_13140 [Nocardia sp. NEAU-G5]|uniref:Uncharacterized protein n=1 Tax=Nocardia albiluteola TaxID=2842303 RepID=A0ABS6AWP0_9NOCA|nr:hypothetical protein [Nocardia albiluteola]MBU3062464.1 hypothetical protein [Nocardia albiluteola]
MRITGHSGVTIDLDPLRWQFPANTGEWDDRWLVISVHIDLGDNNWGFTDPCLLINEARELASWLRIAADGSRSPHNVADPAESDLWFLEPLLGFSIAESQPAKPVIRVHFAAEGAPPWSHSTTPGEKFTLDLPVTRGQLVAAADELTRQLNALPARPWIDTA